MVVVVVVWRGWWWQCSVGELVVVTLVVAECRWWIATRHGKQKMTLLDIKERQRWEQWELEKVQNISQVLEFLVSLISFCSLN